MENHSIDTPALAEAASWLRAGRPLAYPTETFYGLGCLALEPLAIERLEALKPRAQPGMPYPLIIGAVSQLSLVVSSLPKGSERWFDAFWPGPLTLILPALPSLSSCLRGPSGGVAVRISSHPWAAALAQLVEQPLISTSANPSGQAPPEEAAQVRAYFPSLKVLDGGRCPGGAPSTIIDLTGPQARPVRWGAIPQVQLRAWADAHQIDLADEGEGGT